MANSTTDSRTFENVATIAVSAFLKEKVFDQVMTAAPMLAWFIGRDMPEVQKYQLGENLPDELKEEKTAIFETSGVRIEAQLEYDSNDSVRWVSPWESAPIENQELYTKAIYEWKNLMGSIVLSEIEEGMTEGSEVTGEKLMRLQTNSLKKAMVKDLQLTIFLDGTGSDGKALSGLQLYIADDPTTGTVGSINRANEAWWRNQQTAQGGALSNETNMVTVFHNCSLGNSLDTPTFIVTTQSVYEQVETITRSRERLNQNQGMANIGFEHFLFKNRAIVTYDGNCPAQHMYFLSKQGLKFAVNPNLKMKMREFSFKDGSFVKEAPVVLQCEIVAVEPRRLGVLTGITG